MAAWLSELPFRLKCGQIGRGQPAPPAPQPVVDRLVRCFDGKGRRGLIQQAIGDRGPRLGTM